jgi:hypothetical protein
MNMTKAETLAELALWKAAYTKLATTGIQSYSMGTVALTRTDLPQIKTRVDELTQQLNRLEAEGAASTTDFAYNQPGVSVARVR